MKTININFTLSDRQWEYLRLAKCDQPNPQRIKMMLLSQAASTLRREGELVMQEARQSVVTERGQEEHIKAGMPPVRPATKAEIDLNNLRRQVKKKIIGGLVLTKGKGKKPNHSDRSAQPMTGAEWMDDDNIAKLRDE